MTEERPIFDLREHFPRLAASPAGRQLIGLFEGLLGFRRVRRLLRQLDDRCAEGEPPFDAFLSLMGFVPDAPGVVEAIPREGAVVLVCNHPFGGADALVASTLAMRAREDTRVMANAELSAINALKPSLIITEIMGRDGDERRNISALRESLSHLRDGGALVVFPAGAVARWQPERGRVDELPWSPHISRLILKAKAPVLPVRFFGGNPAWFHLLGALHPLVRSALIPRVFLAQEGEEIPCRAGELLTPEKFPADAEKLTVLMRKKLEELVECPGN